VQDNKMNKQVSDRISALIEVLNSREISQAERCREIFKHIQRIVALLPKDGIDKKFLIWKDEVPLIQVAACWSAYDAVKFLIENGANASVRSTKNKWTSLLFVVGNKYVSAESVKQVIDLLVVEDKSMLEKAEIDGDTPLRTALNQGLPEVAQYLIEKYHVNVPEDLREKVRSILEEGEKVAIGDLPSEQKEGIMTAKTTPALNSEMFGAADLKYEITNDSTDAIATISEEPSKGM